MTSLEGPVRTANITLIADSNSVTVKWNITVVPETDEQLKSSRDEIFTLIRRISLRPFGTDNVTRLFVLEDFNLTALSLKSHPSEGSPRYYTLNQLNPSTAYVVCFETLPDPADDSEEEYRAEARRGRKAEEKDARNSCWETTTLDEDAIFPVVEVAAAAAVSTSTTAFVVAIVCCCCFPGLCKKKREKKNKKNKDTEKGEEIKKDENDNESLVDGVEGSKIRAHLSRRPHRDVTGSRCSASPVRSTSLPPSTSSYEPELQSIAISKSDDEVRIVKYVQRFSKLYCFSSAGELHYRFSPIHTFHTDQH